MTTEGASVVGGSLYVVAVPIGNLDDASPRMRAVLGEADYIACEDTRTTAKLLSLLGVDPVGKLVAHHAHNERNSAKGLLDLLHQEKSVAVVTDAGTPGISDPGMLIVDAALEAGLQVVSVAGPSALAAAVSVSGCVAETFTFVGFLPRSATELRELIAQHSSMIIAYESPHRLRSTLQRLVDLMPDRPVIVARELTKLHEEVVRGTAHELLEHFDKNEPRGEIVIMCAPAPDAAAHAAIGPAAIALVHEIEEAGVRRKDACRMVARHIGVSQRQLYEVTTPSSQ